MRNNFPHTFSSTSKCTGISAKLKNNTLKLLEIFENKVFENRFFENTQNLVKTRKCGETGQSRLLAVCNF